MIPSESKNREVAKQPLAVCEPLELRQLLSGSNAIDRLDFGNLTSEAAHNFEPGYAITDMPLIGAGALGQTYREPVGNGSNTPTGSTALTFTLATDPSHQDYLSIRLWGSDVPGGSMYLLNAPPGYPAIENRGGEPAFPNRFFYYTVPLPLSMTSGHGSTQITLYWISWYDAYGGTGNHYLSNGQLTRPVYSVYTSTDPEFIPDSADPTGSKLPQTGQATLSTLTTTQAIAILQAERTTLYSGSSSYYNTVINRQVLSTTPGAPLEAVGLDLFTTASTFSGSFDSQIGVQKPQPGYTAFPDELLSVLTSTYLLPPFTDANGNTVAGLDHYHDSSVLQRIVSAMDGASYMQGADGRFAAEGSGWIGLVSNLPAAPTARTTPSVGSSLQGIDTQTLGWSIIKLLNDPTGGPAFQAYLSQSYNADLTNGGSMLRATAYERMLFNHITYLAANSGGTESQNMFEMLGLYANAIALARLQALYPNASYVYSPATALNYAKMVMGLVPDTLRGVNPSPLSISNYGLSAKGLGEAHGILSGGFDGGYGLWLTELAPQFAALAALDSSADAATVAAFESQARAAIDAYDQIISPLENYSGGSSTAYTLGQDDVITYRNVENPNNNADSFQVDSRYLASDPAGVVQDAYARRSAYLETQYNITPSTTAADTTSARLDFLRVLGSYENTIRGLINVNPASMTALPGESLQNNYAWADVQTGAVAFQNNGERFYMNANWRSYEFNDSSWNNLTPSYIARVHDTTATIDRDAMVMLPHDSYTVQSDGNLSGGFNQPVFVRYGDYLIALNNLPSTTTAKLPPGIGVVKDLISGNYYKLGTSVSLAAGQAAIYWLAASVVGPGIDVGAAGVAGSESYDNASHTYSVTGAGADIGGTVDAFQFVPANVSGDVDLVAQVLSQTAGDPLAQAGVMIRDGTAANAVFAAVVRTPGNGIRFEWRSTTGGAVAWVAVPAPLTPVWVRLARSGGNATAYDSTDGSNWNQIGSAESLPFGLATSAGLAVCSHNTGATSSAVFANVRLTSDSQSTANSAPTVATAANASASLVGGTTVNLSVLGADDGGASNLTYTWQLVTGPPVTYSANGTNAAKNTTVIFKADGAYTFHVFITDAFGLTITSDVSVTVQQTLTSLSVYPNPAPVYLAGGASQTFTATPLDQFGAAIANSSNAPVWSIDSGGVGTITSAGVYTAPANGAGSATVRATVGSVAGSAAVTCIGVFTASQDIGAPALAGSASYNASTSTYTVIGGGLDIWVGNDQFRYVYAPFTGNGTITARVASMTNSDTTNGWAKIGVMLRSDLSDQSAYAMMSVTTTHGFNFQWRYTNSGSPGQSTTGSGGGGGWVRLVRSGNLFTSYYSSDGSTWLQTAISSQTIIMPTTIYVGLAVCSHNVGVLNTSTFTNVSISSTPTPPIFPYHQDVGTPTDLGSYTDAAGVVTMTGAGSDIWGSSDQFHFAWQPITGNVTITTRVVSLANTDSNAKAGVMIGNGLDAGAIQASVLLTPGTGIHFERRSSTNGSSSETDSSVVSAPYWVRIVRSSNTFKAYTAVDNSGVAGTFVQLGSTQTITMNSTVYVGLALCSHHVGTLTTATFDNVTVTGTADAAPTVTTAAAASPATVTGTTSNLSVTGADSDGGGASNLSYSWAVLIGPPAGVAFSANGTTAAAATTATFTGAGVYTIGVTITDSGGLTASSSVTVTVNQTLSGVIVTPALPTVAPATSTTFSAVAVDQFAQPMTTQPSSFTWSITSGAGSITSGAVFTAPAASGSTIVKAATGSVSGTTTVTTTDQTPIIATSSGAAAGAVNTTVNTAALSVPAADDTGEPNLTYTWSVIGTPPLPVKFSPNGTNTAKNTTTTFNAIGTYTLMVTITDPGGQSTTSTVNVTVNTILGTGGNDTIRLVRSSSNLAVYINNPSTPAYTVPFAGLGAIAVSTSNGTDIVNVDFSGGAAPVPAAGLTVTEDGSTGDTLIVTGTTFADAATVDGSTVTFNSSVITYSQAPSIIINGNGGADVLTQSAQPGGGATLSFNGGSSGGPSSSDTLIVNVGTYAFALLGVGAGVVPLNLGSLTIGAGAMVSIPTASAHADRYIMVTSTLSMGGSTNAWTGTLDLGGNDLIVHGGNLTNLTNQLQMGFNTAGGYWNGTGIISSTAQTSASHLTTLGAIQNLNAAGNGAAYTAFDGVTGLTTSDVLVKYTYYGDADLSGSVAANDYTIIDAHNGIASGATWGQGDFNYDGKVDGSDYSLIDNAFNTQGTSIPSASPASEVMAAGPNAGKVMIAKFTIVGTAPNGATYFFSDGQPMLDFPALNRIWADEVLEAIAIAGKK